jgi:hypothetical protein
VKKLCSVQYGIEHFKLITHQKERGPEGVKFRRLAFDLHLLLGSATIKFSAFYKSHKVAWIEAKYMEEFAGSFRFRRKEV